MGDEGGGGWWDYWVLLTPIPASLQPHTCCMCHHALCFMCHHELCCMCHHLLAHTQVENANIPTVAYELPDGSELQIGPDRFKVPEVLFRPVCGWGCVGGWGGWVGGCNEVHVDVHTPHICKHHTCIHFIHTQELLSAFKGMEDVKGYDGSALQPLQGMLYACLIAYKT